MSMDDIEREDQHNTFKLGLQQADYMSENAVPDFQNNQENLAI